MKKIEDIVVIVQARSTSQRLPMKMTKSFGDTNLVEVILNKLKTSKVIPKENIYLSAYDTELIDIANTCGISVFYRSKDSRDYDGGKTPIRVQYEWWDKLPFKYAIQVNACHPFLTIESIDKFVEKYMEIESEGQFAVIEKHNYFWNKDGDFITPWPEGQSCLNTKAVEITYEAAHCLYAGRMDKIGDGVWMGDFNIKRDINLFPVNESESLDIDYGWQFDMAESYYKLFKEEK